MGRGEILATLAQLADDPAPELKELVSSVARLTHDQVDGFCRYAKGRIDAIRSLQTLVNSVNFKSGNNENVLHGMLKDSPWLIDPAYFEFFTSEKSQKNIYKELVKQLQVGEHIPDGYNLKSSKETDPGEPNRRPDLVFLLGDGSGSRLVIIELKAPNTPLHHEHLMQLQDYMDTAEKWASQNGRTLKVEGLLIGSFGPIKSKANQVERLNREINKAGPTTLWKVLSLSKLLELTEAAHSGLVEAWDTETLTE